MTFLDSTSKSNNAPGVPDAYTEGWIPFLGCSIYLDSHPLIPRPETEWWVEHAIKDIQKRPNPHILDLFAGSGCVGVAVLAHVPTAHVDFGELESRHLPTIEKNIRLNTIDPKRATLIVTDVWSAVPGAYDFVLANPPYLCLARSERIEDSVIEHEPAAALFADDEGFRLIDRTLELLKTHLAPGGTAWIEHEPEHSLKLQKTATERGMKAVTHKDQYGVERYSVILVA